MQLTRCVPSWQAARLNTVLNFFVVLNFIAEIPTGESGKQSDHTPRITTAIIFN
jgi:hypothetical protein